MRGNARAIPPNVDVHLPCLLAAVVCDIRGFTSLAARVNDYVHSPLGQWANGYDLLNGFRRYAAATQKLASDKILGELDLHQEKDFFAVKSTGDGLLVAVKLGGYTPRERRKIVDGGIVPLDIADKIKKLAGGLVELVDEASDFRPVSSRGTKRRRYGALTLNFVKRWAPELGYEPRWLSARDSSLFRVAGAISVGMGFLFPGKEENLVKQAPASFGDAFGHTVNLAFRLCDQACRRLDRCEWIGPKVRRLEEMSPPILLDRRAAAALCSQGSRFVFNGVAVSPRPYPIRLRMEGIEEEWSYYMSPTRRGKK